ncbi:DNA-binding response OmpR family regulator [Peptoniphilus koenoeneniae]|uniref:DNA-binding response OmpR family regulator n=1 Tax=Peptoniphilus koenoeneniae TaxID=507751 RepID=A0ABU0AT16_9FIRM|nr:response regulator transcription factor [Peptoniphilus koenoeneniae]MDQ0274009.1 DNA-binding response OmpR family regulator [Peptoniphilus koenoeneniae]
MKILIIEDNIDINNLLRDILIKENYEVRQCFTAMEALLQKDLEEFDLMILDLMMPVKSGEEFIKEIRDKSISIPIIVISAKIDVDSRVNVLNIGADDFIKKPFEKEDVLARIQANIRRYREFSKINSSLNYKNLKYNKQMENFTINGNELQLTKTELNILKLFIKNQNRIFTKKNLYEAVWQDNFAADEDTINVHISNIRNKIKKFDSEEYIETVWGIGYRLRK